MYENRTLVRGDNLEEMRKFPEHASTWFIIEKVLSSRVHTVSSGYEKRKPKPSYYSIQVSDLENVRYLRLSGVFDVSP
ncbi:MAG: hypothetical protein OXU51_18875, partial [Candidatus Poribacteria bacterium]|nr:hypothetical protein [Candidatus Poribacteria bacterium]